MTGLVTDLTVAAKLASRSLSRSLFGETEPAANPDDFVRQLQALLAAAPQDLVREHCWLSLAASSPPWLDAGMALSAGDEVTYFACGRVYANRMLDIYVTPGLNLWSKIGDGGEVFRGTRDSHSFTADRDGQLQFGNYFPNDWANKQGARKQSDTVYSGVSGELKILVIRWHHSAIEGLRALQGTLPSGLPSALQGADDAGPSCVSSEVARLEQGDTTPQGWYYRWHVGPAEIYRLQQRAEQGDCIHCRTHKDVGILQKDVDLPLQEDSEISWRWCIEQLPSTLREDSLPSHDYLSIAVEFDNGRDITYYWSSKLAEGTGYDCPLPNWAGIEFHVVVRSGQKGLGDWLNERRNLYQDYQHYMGEPPARIVRVWLIANSIFQRGEGRCDYSDIVLHTGDSALRVL